MEKIGETELDIKKYFICEYCKLIVVNPNEKECCGTLICSECIPYYKSKNSKYCETCNSVIMFRKNFFAKRLLYHMDIKCIFECGFSEKYEKIRDHLAHCEKRLFYCQDCNFYSTKQEFKKHFIENHDDIFFEMIDYNNKNNSKLNEKRRENMNLNLNNVNTNDEVNTEDIFMDKKFKEKEKKTKFKRY